MKKLTTLLLLLSCFALHSQVRDSTIFYDSTYKTTHDTTSRFSKVIQVGTPVVTTEVHGMYFTASQCSVGDPLSEGAFLVRCKRDGVNELNGYLRAYLTSSTKRTQLAAFVKKARTYGIISLTIDTRGASEFANWELYMQSYGSTTSRLDGCLTEFEPYRLNDKGIYPYDEFFALIKAQSAFCKKWNMFSATYQGWLGQHYSGGVQAAWDIAANYIDRLYLSNYVTQSVYNSSGGAWDSRMDQRTVNYSLACKKAGKAGKIVEITSLELIKWGAGSDFLGNVFACPKTTTQNCVGFYDLSRTYADYNKGPYSIATSEVLTWTDVIGRTQFYAKYAVKAQP